MSVISFYFRTKRKFHNWSQLRKVGKYGENTNVFGDVTIVNPSNLTIGNNCSLNHGVYINAFNPIVLGDDVTISASAKLLSTGIDYDSWIKGEKKHTQTGEIQIGNHVWIGCGAIISPGVSISGEFVVIAAGAVVTHDISESYCLYGGCPAKMIKSLK
ncbi:MAG: acyltransferase [Clostridiales bacterium]|nr:acyltransferase [Clostridiales bacterium]